MHKDERTRYFLHFPNYPLPDPGKNTMYKRDDIVNCFKNSSLFLEIFFSNSWSIPAIFMNFADLSLKKNWENEKIFQVKNLFHLMIYPEIFEKFFSQIFTSDKMIATLNIIIIIIA